VLAVETVFHVADALVAVTAVHEQGGELPDVEAALLTPLAGDLGPVQGVGEGGDHSQDRVGQRHGADGVTGRDVPSGVGVFPGDEGGDAGFAGEGADLLAPAGFAFVEEVAHEEGSELLAVGVFLEGGDVGLPGDLLLVAEMQSFVIVRVHSHRGRSSFVRLWRVGGGSGGTWRWDPHGRR
jgi:hypothetical protein